MFINRIYELELLNKKLECFLNGNWQNTYHHAFLGLRRTGKTYLLQYFASQNKEKVKIVYLNVSKYQISPYSFSLGLITQFIDAIYGKIGNILDKVEDVQILKQWQNIEKLYEENKIDIAMNKVFELITYLSEKYGKFVVILDEFQDFFSFTNYPKLKNIEAVFRDNLENQKNIFYIVSGSFPSILKGILNNPKHYLYSHFEIVDIYNFDKDNSKKLTLSLRNDLKKQDIENIFYLSGGNPYLIVNLTPEIVPGEGLKELLNKNLFNINGKIYNYFLYILEESLNKIPGNTSLLGVLKEICFADGINTTQISKNIRLQVGVVQKALKLLGNVDLIYSSLDKKWYIQNYIFRYFLKYYFLGIDDFEYEKSDYLKNKVSVLQEEFARVSQDLGRTKEFELYYEIKEYQGKNWKGIKLPKFKVIKKNYYTEYGDELDIYCETMRGKKWIFELKHKKKQVGVKEIEKFIRKIDVDKYLYISKSGFVNSAYEKYKDNKKVFLLG